MAFLKEANFRLLYDNSKMYGMWHEWLGFNLKPELTSVPCSDICPFDEISQMSSGIQAFSTPALKCVQDKHFFLWSS